MSVLKELVCLVLINVNWVSGSLRPNRSIELYIYCVMCVSLVYFCFLLLLGDRIRVSKWYEGLTSAKP